MKVVTLGEIMLRLTPHGYNRLVQADDFEAVYGGAEATLRLRWQIGENTRPL